MINLVNNRPFGKEISKIPEQNQNLYGVEVISEERYVPRVEVQTKEDLKDVTDKSLSIYPPTAPYYNGLKFIYGAAQDYNNGNLDNTIDNIVNFSIPLGLKKIGVPKTPSNVIPAGIDLMDDLNEN
jgi:hypothetical protein